MALINKPSWIDTNGDIYDMPQVTVNYPNTYRNNNFTLNAPITYCGTTSYKNLPFSGNEVGDSYRLEDGNLVIWDGYDWSLIESISSTASSIPGNMPTVTVSSISGTIPTVTADSISGTIPLEQVDNKKLSFEENLEKLEKRAKELEYKETRHSLYDQFSDISKRLVDQEALADAIQNSLKQMSGYNKYIYSNSNWGGNK